MKIEISENTIPTIIGQAAKHNEVAKGNVTQEMFQDELGNALKYKLFEQVKEEYKDNIYKNQEKEDEEAVKALIEQAKINLGAENGMVLQIDGQPEYVFVGKDVVQMRVGENINLEYLMRELNIESSVYKIFDFVEQGDGTTIYKFIQSFRNE